jgi:hypothetical protein
MRELRSAVLGDRRVRLLVDQHGHYAVTIEVLGPEGAWEDISLLADQLLPRRYAIARFDRRLAEQEARASEREREA